MGTQSEIAAKLGFSDRWLRKLVEDGVLKDPGRNAWDFADTARQIIEYQGNQIARQKAENASLRAQISNAEGSSANKSDEDARLAKAKADKAEMEVAVMRRELVPIDEVAEVMHGSAIIVKTRLNGIAAKAAPLAHGAPTVAAAEKAIREQVDEALAELGKTEIITGKAKADKAGS